VILIGIGPSSFDISRDIASVAKEVHVATRLKPDLNMKLENIRNICFHTLVYKKLLSFMLRRPKFLPLKTIYCW
jgi:hypothetical protein